MTNRVKVTDSRFRSEHSHWLSVVGQDNVHNVEHIRVPLKNELGRFKHFACVVLKDGRAAVGTSRPFDIELYTTARGYSVAVGKALRTLGRGTDLDHMFMVDTELEGRDYFNQIRAKMREMYPYSL